MAESLPARRQVVLQKFNVLNALYERKADEIRVNSDKIQIAKVLGVSGGSSISVPGKLRPLSVLSRTPFSRAA